MGFGAQTDGSRTLLYGLEGILDLVQPSLGREDGVVRVVGIAKLFSRMIDEDEAE